MNYTREEVLNAACIGFEFEFLSNDKPINIARELGDLLGIKVIVPMNADKLNKLQLKYHTPIIVTPKLFKLESDFSGGSNMRELVTGPLHYKEARVVLLKILSWIDNNAWTTDRAACQINISFNEWKIKMPIKITQMNILKFCLNFDEEYIWKRFPNRRGSLYAKTIKHIISNNIFNINPNAALTQFIVVPNKYYSVNFMKVDKGYIEFRAIGGANYQRKKQDIVDILDFSILSLFSLSQKTELNQNDIYKLKKILKKNYKFLQVYKNPERIYELFKDIRLSVNLDTNIAVIKTMWNHIKDKIMYTLLLSGTEMCDINYDSDESKIQLKDADLNFAELKNIEILNCTGFGIFKNCDIYNSNLEKSNLMSCNAMSNNILTDCKIEKTELHKGNIIKNCFVANEDSQLINCKVEGGILRKGIIGANAIIDNNVECIDITENKPKIYKGIFGTYKTPKTIDFKQAKILFANKK